MPVLVSSMLFRGQYPSARCRARPPETRSVSSGGSHGLVGVYISGSQGAITTYHRQIPMGSICTPPEHHGNYYPSSGRSHNTSTPLWTQITSPHPCTTTTGIGHARLRGTTITTIATITTTITTTRLSKDTTTRLTTGTTDISHVTLSSSNGVVGAAGISIDGTCMQGYAGSGGSVKDSKVPWLCIGACCGWGTVQAWHDSCMAYGVLGAQKYHLCGRVGI